MKKQTKKDKKDESEAMHPMLHGHMTKHSKMAMKEAEGHMAKGKKKMKPREMRK